ncbi:MAG TPA: GyrI-like domain-containing protein [Micromonosporaceae bacterium]|nr:GyrI-like domain-containing protein [Micromonosporaceae bacterium]
MTAPLTYEVDTHMLAGRYTAVVRGEMPPEELPAWLAGVFQAVDDYLARTGVTPTGPPFARFTVLGHVLAVEAGFPVAHEVPGDDLVEPSALPDGPAVVTTHWGAYEGAQDAYLACRGWLDDHGYQPAGPHWEVYHTDPDAEPDPARWRTDVVVPYRQTHRS